MPSRRASVTGSNSMGSTFMYFALHFNGSTIFDQDDKKQSVKNYDSGRWSVWTAFQRGALERGTLCFI